MVRGLTPNEKLLNHSTVVAEIAAFLASAMARRGVAVDPDLVAAAALLHDLDKMLPADDPLRALGHGAAGAEWLRQRGFDELAPAVANHPVMAIARPDSYEAWVAQIGLPGQIVAYADKRGRQQIVPLDDRFADWHRRYPDSPPLDEAHSRARRLEREVCELAGIQPEDVAREPWVADALRDAAAAGAAGEADESDKARDGTA